MSDIVFRPITGIDYDLDSADSKLDAFICQAQKIVSRYYGTLLGITQGLIPVGAYGNETRKVFGALGNDVNLAVRLMMTARGGEILVSGHVHKSAANQFTFEPRPEVSPFLFSD